MRISYKKLWILLIEKEISPATLRKDLNIATGTMTKMRRNEEVALSVLLRICEYLDCNIGDICDAQHMHTRTANFGAYQVEKQAEVGVAGANALGQMGANGAGDVNIGGGGDGTGFNMAAMVASMAVGGAVGQNIAGAMNNMMGGINQQTTPGAVPPPIPVVAYHVAVNGQATGPFDISVLAQMATAGQLTVDSLVWKNGMAQWTKAGTVDELKNLFSNVMPPIPPQE